MTFKRLREFIKIMPLQRWKLGDETSLTPSVVPSTTSSASKTEALSIPENPIKEQSRVSLRWLTKYYRKKMGAHQSICQKYLLKGRSRNAEIHRQMALEYKQKKEDLANFRRRRIN